MSDPAQRRVVLWLGTSTVLLGTAVACLGLMGLAQWRQTEILEGSTRTVEVELPHSERRLAVQRSSYDDPLYGLRWRCRFLLEHGEDLLELPAFHLCGRPSEPAPIYVSLAPGPDGPLVVFERRAPPAEALTLAVDLRGSFVRRLTTTDGLLAPECPVRHWWVDVLGRDVDGRAYFEPGEDCAVHALARGGAPMHELTWPPEDMRSLGRLEARSLTWRPD